MSPRLRTGLILPEQLFTVREAAQRLSISRALLYKLCAQNQVLHLRVGNTIRFTPADLSTFVRARRSLA